MVAKNLMRNKEVIKRMETHDHNKNFDNHPTVQLTNPANNELGRISKLILDKINKNLVKNLS